MIATSTTQHTNKYGKTTDFIRLGWNGGTSGWSARGALAALNGEDVQFPSSVQKGEAGRPSLL